jgi:hypothetical protein
MVVEGRQVVRIEVPTGETARQSHIRGAADQDVRHGRAVVQEDGRVHVVPAVAHRR